MAQDSSDKAQDTSDKVEKLLRGASVGAASSKLEQPFNIQHNVTSSTSISFEDHQYKHSNKEINIIAVLLQVSDHVDFLV